MSRLAAFFGRPTPTAPLPWPPHSPEGLVARWVRWVAAHDDRQNPVSDPTGAHAGHHQPEDVWFLAGSYGETVRRRCAVPAGRPLFFPAFNMWQWPAGPGELPVVSRATGYALVDGVAVPVATIGTATPFEVRGVAGNGVTDTARPVRVSCWGLWATVAPLPPGPHTVAFGGTDGHGFRVDAHYEVRVG